MATLDPAKDNDAMMNFANLLRDPPRPPSKRWAAAYLASLIGGFLLTSYAEEIAHKLAPAKPDDVIVEAAPLVGDYPTPEVPDNPEQFKRFGGAWDPSSANGAKSLDIETLAATDLD